MCSAQHLQSEDFNCEGTGTVHAEDAATAALLGMRTRTYRFQPVAQIKLETDFQFRYRSPSWL